MFTHEQIWNGVETLAFINGVSVSKLARAAGLDSTCFNKSKRRTSSGQLRWISTESLNKVLSVTDTKLSSFGQLIEENH